MGKFTYFFYTSGLLEKIINFHFGNGYHENYFEVNGCVVQIF